MSDYHSHSCLQLKASTTVIPKFSAAFIFDKEKHKALIAKIQAGCEAVAKEKWGAKVPKKVIMCLHDGEEKEDIDGYGEDVMFLTASNTKRPQVVDRGRQPNN